MGNQNTAQTAQETATDNVGNSGPLDHLIPLVHALTEGVKDAGEETCAIVIISKKVGEDLIVSTGLQGRSDVIERTLEAVQDTDGAGGLGDLMRNHTTMSVLKMLTRAGANAVPNEDGALDAHTMD